MLQHVWNIQWAQQYTRRKGGGTQQKICALATRIVGTECNKSAIQALTNKLA
jgi:hypothetical protein